MTRILVFATAAVLLALGSPAAVHAEDGAATPPVVEAPQAPANDAAPPEGMPAVDVPPAPESPGSGDPAPGDAAPAAPGTGAPGDGAPPQVVDPATGDDAGKPKKPKGPRKPKKPVDPCEQVRAGQPPAPGTQDAAAGAGVRPGQDSAVDPSACSWPTVPTPTGPVGSGQPAPALPDWQAIMPNAVDPEQLARAQEKVDALKDKVNAASAAFQEALAAQRAAEDAARLAEWEALMARVRAEQARDVLARYAAGVYRSGGGTTSLVAIVNGSLGDPGRVLDEQTYLRQATGAKKDEVAQAREVLAEAEALTREAARAQDAAAAATTTAQSQRNAMTQALSEAQTELKTLQQAAVSAQTLIGDDGCPTAVPANTLRGGAETWDVAELCARSVASAATPEAALAIKYAFRALGAPYACGGAGRSLPFRFDCSSLVSRAYAEGAGLNTAGDGWAPSTRDMVPWDGVPLAPWAGYVAPEAARPGDLVLYDTGGAVYRHVVMLLSDGYMLHTNSCGDVAKVEPFWGFGSGHGTFLVTRRVIPSMAR